MNAHGCMTLSYPYIDLLALFQCDYNATSHGTHGFYDVNFLSIVFDSWPRCRSLTSLRIFETKFAQRLDNDDCRIRDVKSVGA